MKFTAILPFDPSATLNGILPHIPSGKENTKIRAIPARVLFNDSDLNLQAEYSAFDRQTGRPLYVGIGEVAITTG